MVDVPGRLPLFPAALGLLLLAAGILRALITNRWQFREHCASLFACGPREPVMLRAVRRRLLDQKVQRVQMLHLLLALLLVPQTVATLGGPSWPLYNTPPSDLQLLVTALQQLLLAVVAFHPNFITARSMDFFCGALLLVEIVAITPWVCATAENLQWVAARYIVVWAAICAVRRTSGAPFFYLLAPASALSLWSSMFVHGRPDGSMAAAAEKKGSPSGGVGAFLITQALLLGGAHLLERAAESKMATTLRGEEAKQLLEAASAILRSCFDVVTELDSQGQVLGKAQDLNSYLLRASSLQSMPILDLLVNKEEQMQLRERLFAPQEGRSVAESMNVNMRDGNNNILRVELLWFSFSRFNEELAFMVGIREQSETTQVVGGLSEVPLDADRASWVVSSEASSASESESASPGPGDDGALDLPSVLLDSTLQDFPVQELSSSFCMRVGRLPVDQPFVKHLCKPEDFARWLRGALQATNCGSPVARHRVTFRMPQGKVEARCNLAPVHGQLDLENIQLCFSRIKLKGSVERRRDSLNLGTPASRRGLVTL